MPKYNFTCECGYSVKKYTPKDRVVLPCPQCDKNMNREMPILNGPPAKREVVNELLNSRWCDDQKQIIQARKEKYYWSIEVPRMVNSGTYTVQTMLEKGWIWIDDNSQMHIHTKPPNER
jgi:hypothetical protein